VCPSVHPYTKSFSDIDIIWYVGRPWPHMRISESSTRSKVKIKVTYLLKLRKLHFSMSISFAIFAWSSKLMVGLQFVRATFSNSLLGKLSREFKLRGMSIFHEIQMAIFRYCVRIHSHDWHAGSRICIVYIDMTLIRSQVAVKVTLLLNFLKLPKVSLFYIYLLRHFRVQLKTDGSSW